MAEEEKKEKKKRLRAEKKKENGFVKQLQIAYRSIEDRKKFYRSTMFPLIGLGILVMMLPFIVGIISPVSLGFNPITFIIGGVVPIILAVLFPYVKWKSKESEINGKIHFFITHLRVLAISDLSLKDIINVLAGNKAYGALGEEIRKISVLSDQWRLPLAKSFVFVSQRTPSKIFRDFLDRFSQSLVSGVDHREFIETEQGAVLEEYKTIYEASNENITILNEVYVSLLIAIIFIMTLGIVLPMIMGANDMNMFIFLSSFLLIVSEALLLYLISSMVPKDEVWHLTGEQGDMELKLKKMFRNSVVLCIAIGAVLGLGKFYLQLPIINMFSLEMIIAIALTPLFFPGLKALRIEGEITRKEKNFLGFLPALGSIATMRGGKINESVYYLSEKDYGVLSQHIKDLYRRLRTRINDDDSWEWFGIDTGSNYIQRSSEMFRQATAASANPRDVSRMISENVRKIKDLRVKKYSVIHTSAALFAGITFAIVFSVFTALVISRHLNDLLIESTAGNPFESAQLDIGAILSTIPPQAYVYSFSIIFIVFVIHCFMLAYTIRNLRGSHKLVTLAYFIPYVWVVAVTAFGVDNVLTKALGI